jgi:tripartite-type tricarboxylate transporter receptor subunit TctC
MPSLPEVVTVAESGFGYEDHLDRVLRAGRHARAIVDNLIRHRRDPAAPDTKERLATLGFDTVNNTPQQFTAYIREEVTKWAKVIKESGARVD